VLPSFAPLPASPPPGVLVVAGSIGEDAFYVDVRALHRDAGGGLAEDLDRARCLIVLRGVRLADDRVMVYLAA
jgi:hypothetical protein